MADNTSDLLSQLAEAEARVAQLKQAVAQGPCATYGHDWSHIGGRNCGCGDDGCCSVPVYQCRKCGDCDYGDNPEAAAVIAKCWED